MPHVLVAEDSADDLELFTMFLKMGGYSVTAVDTTDALLAAVYSSSPPDVLLLDLILDRANGLEVVQTIRADTRSASLPIVGITAATPRYVEAVAMKAGCDVFLTKPCQPAEVSQALHAAMLLRPSI